ncbi:Dabb family protein [Chitinimonas taiwanensis]|uniref:Dabb family protein n=1 Tax=Chitinimonas taiwanensis TaxID=240412 RepID=UPI0035B3DB28
MLLRHLVLLQFRADTAPEVLNALLADFAALPSKIPGISALEWGQNNSIEGLDKGFSHCFLLSFVDAAARDAYLPHPEHQALVARLKAQLADVLVLDYYPQG